MEKFRQELIATAKKIATPGKGILAADESTGTIGKRFAPIGVDNTEENRRAYREILLCAPQPIEQYISGVIMFEETLFQKDAKGVPFVDCLIKRGIVPGIKVDKGTINLFGTDNETFTQGLDGLGERCAKYYKQGARFAKWRAVLKISGDKCPSELSVQENARGLARYAVICQENGLVPIVEPEVLMDGPHDLEHCARVTEYVIQQTYRACTEAHMLLEGSLLKPNMVLPGTECKTKYTAQQIAQATLTVLRRSVPPAVPGIVFLSGGMSEEEASVNLNAINTLPELRPWNVAFSYGRALQASALKAWKGKPENFAAAREAFFVRAKANGEAVLGKYAGGAATGEGAAESLHVKDYKY